jgi:hypothetical protein
MPVNKCSCGKGKSEKNPMEIYRWIVAVFGIGTLLFSESKAEIVVVGEPVQIGAYPESRGRGVQVINNINTGGVAYQAPKANSGRAALYQDYEGCAPGRPCGVPPVEKVEYVPAPKPAPVMREKPKPAKKISNEPRYDLPDPFFQPLQGHVGSVTDLGFYSERFGFDIIDCTGPWGGLSGDWKTSGWNIKEDLSVGITDQLALVGSLKYSNYKYNMNWDDPSISNDKAKKSGIEVWGLGLQWKFYEDQDWVMYLGGYYQSYWGGTNAFMGDSKIGYKFDSLTLYGLLRLGYLNLKDPNYGYSITNASTNQTVFMVLGYDSKNVLLIEGGAGIYAKLAQEWSLNLEAVYGSYEWHNNMSGKAAIYWQPTNNFAFGIYGKTTLFDSVNSRDRPFGIYSNDPASATPNILTHKGDISINNYRETQFGVQAFLYF